MPMPQSSAFVIRTLAVALCVITFTGAVFLTEIKAEEPKKTVASEESMAKTLEKLYGDYEKIDSALKASTASTPSVPSTEGLLVPLTVTIKKNGNFRLSSVEVTDNGLPLWGHIYDDEENMAMDKGGRHFLYRSETAGGKHTISVEYGFSPDNDKEEVLKRQSAWTYKAGREPVVLEIIFEKAGNNVVAKPGMLRVVQGK
ncbi:MAG: hypothetical protein OEV59_01745 [Deltaproteobacteria bacterium]|nr:hypothetical protein [Deltaproteobacteria bacterium]